MIPTYIRTYACIIVSLYHCRFVDYEYDLWVIISMMVMRNANVIIEHDRRRLGLSSAPLDVKYDNISIEQ